MKFIETDLPGVLVIEPEIFADDRGCFFDSFRHDAFADAGLPTVFAQDSHSRSARHVLRGLHFQFPVQQGKLVRVASGAVFDVVVDVRRGSPTFAQWLGFDLDDENKKMLWIPEGYAHGFCALSDSADVLYKLDAPYMPGQSRSIRWDDPDIGIDWPVSGPVISDADRTAPLLKDAEHLPAATASA